MALGGGVTAGLRAWTMALEPYMCGSYIHMFGYDSSASQQTFNSLYAYQKDESVKVDEKYYSLALLHPKTNEKLPTVYKTNFSMRQQAANMEELFVKYAKLIVAGKFSPCSFYMHGTGLGPDWGALKGIHFNPNRKAEVLNPPRTELNSFSFDNFNINNVVLGDTWVGEPGTFQPTLTSEDKLSHAT